MRILIGAESTDDARRVEALLAGCALGPLSAASAPYGRMPAAIVQGEENLVLLVACRPGSSGLRAALEAVEAGASGVPLVLLAAELSEEVATLAHRFAGRVCLFEHGAGPLGEALLRAEKDGAERRELKALRAGELARRIVNAGVSDALFLLRVEGDRFRFTEINPVFAKATGLSPDQVVGKLVDEVIPEPSRALVLAKYREAIAERRAVRWDEVTKYPTGTKHGAVMVAPIIGVDGRCTDLAGVVHDVTEAYERDEAIRALEAFSYSVAHDLRAPLRSIEGFSTLLFKHNFDALDEDGRVHLQRIRAAGERMGALIEDLLRLAHMSRAAVEREAVDLTPLARGILAEFAEADPGRRVTVEVAESLVASMDRRLAAVMLGNLLGNAWKFTAHQPRARIEVGREPRDGGMIFFVRDNGVGFEMAQAERLFKPFQRLHAQAEFPGTGVGLATVQRIVSRHGGRVWAEAAPGLGATFFFTLGESP